jgi:prolyl-tRNA editing enzyme YbaK/EbsC (Cys-tRNA(Pro) deacylase)
LDFLKLIVTLSYQVKSRLVEALNQIWRSTGLDEVQVAAFSRNVLLELTQLDVAILASESRCVAIVSTLMQRATRNVAEGDRWKVGRFVALLMDRSLKIQDIGQQISPAIIVKLAKGFKLKPSHVDLPLVLAYVEQLLTTARRSSPSKVPSSQKELAAANAREKMQRSCLSTAAKLTILFELVPRQLDELFEGLIDMSSSELAVELAQLARKHDPAIGGRLIQLLLDRDQLKMASKAVKLLELQAAFPDVEQLHRQRKVLGFIEKGMVELAASIVCKHPALQLQFVNQLLACDEVDLALEYRDRFKLHDVLPLDAASIELHRQKFDIQHMRLPLQLIKTCVVMACAETFACGQALLDASLARYKAAGQLAILGMDSEWKPSSLSGRDEPVAILQLATPNIVVILDLQELCAEVYSQWLQSLFLDEAVIKTGYAFRGDMKKLAAMSNSGGCFQRMLGFVELESLGNAVWPGWGIGLSHLCNHVFGKRLSKVDRMSDWSRRPLTARQLHYAALDAWVCAQALIELLTKAEYAPAVPMDVPLQDTPLVASRLAAHVHELEAGFKSKRKSKLAPISGGPKAVVSTGAGALPQIDMDHLTSAFEGLQLEWQPKGSVDEPLTTDDVRQYLAARNLDVGMLVSHDQAVGTSAKSIAFMVGDRPLIVLLESGRRASKAALATLMGASKRQVTLASPVQCVNLFGYAPGTMPPVAHRQRIPVVCDTLLQRQQELLVFGGGDVVTRLCISAPKLFSIIPVVSCSISDESARGVATLSANDVGGVANLRLLTDAMCGRVTKWLRCAGVDTETVEGYEVKELLSKAAATGRTVITCSSK